MIVFLMFIYALGCAVLGPIWGQQEYTHDGVNRAILATILWPFVIVLGAFVHLTGRN